MAGLNGYTVTPHHRQNRRRERPGSRSRGTITRRSHIQLECSEGLLVAYDTSVPLPSDRTKPSPLLRESFHQSWQRWKDREAEEMAVAELDRLQLEQEQQRLYGGDPSDDELYRLGILYDNVEDTTQDKSVVCEVPLEQPSPLFTLRYRKSSRNSRRNRRRSQRSSLPLYLSLSNLKDDADIVRLLSPSTSTTATKPPIQHRAVPATPPPISLDIPQSLPVAAVPALEESIHSSVPHFLDNTSILPTPHENHVSDWEFIMINNDATLQTTTPSSEPETWILLGDDL
ncbi:uncharacterized protein BP5553_00426 [Venustampulla echinocandica]|uniref:Uncharacterized protein n=1 Tax=Venustampulla echinocandica TaxID=2656787 RepID=A0A370TY43_9HELO|nr:uncharacterized protein BP5553_00426 [Venustampulla echinocandica]RDL40447.1 hypothetical protein BP5553_00426 [Venustampulla echinocandica]